MIMSTGVEQIMEVISQIRGKRDPSVPLVHQLLQSLHVFHIYELEKCLISCDSRMKEAALKKIEQYLPALTSPDPQRQKTGISALEHHYEPIKMLDEDA